MEVEDTRGRDSEQRSVHRPIGFHPAQEQKNREVGHQQRERIGTHVDRGKGDSSGQDEQHGRDERHIPVEQLTRAPVEHIHSGEHGKDGRNPEDEFTVAEQCLGEPQNVGVSSERIALYGARPNLLETAGDLPVGESFVRPQRRPYRKKPDRKAN